MSDDVERYAIGVKVGGRWFVYDKTTDDKVSTHKTREAAIANADRLNAARSEQPR